MAKNNGNKIYKITALLVVLCLILVFFGWATSGYTDWSFSQLTDLFSTEDPTEDPTDDPSEPIGETTTYAIGYDVITSSSFDYDINFDCVTEAAEGERITFTLTVTGDGELYNIVIEGEDGSEIGYTALGDNQYTLVMPAQTIDIFIYINETESDASEILTIGSYVWNSTDDIVTMTWGDDTQYKMIAEINGGDVTVKNYRVTLTSEAKQALADYVTDDVYTFINSTGVFNIKEIALLALNIQKSDASAAYSILYDLYTSGTPLMQIYVNGYSDETGSTTSVFKLLVDVGDDVETFANTL